MDTKDAERAYPETVDETHRGWLHSKPFRNDSAETSRLLVDAALIILVLDLRDGVSLCELGCGTGWLSRLAARQGVRAVGYDISPGMVEIAREEAAREGVDVHHSTRPDLVLATARKTLRPGGRLLLHEPNWMHRFAGRAASQEHGVTEAGYSARRLKQLVDAAGFTEVHRLHRTRRALHSNAPLDVARHFGGPLVTRAMGPFWSEVWVLADAA